MKKQIIFIICISMALAAGFASGARARTATATHSWEDSYVSFLDGSAFGRYPGAEEFGALQENMPLEEGTRLITDQGGLMEMCLYGGITAWMDAETALGVEELFKRVRLSLHEGNVFVRHPQDGEHRFAVEVTASAARVRIFPGSLTRLSLDAGGELVVEVWEGSAEVSGRDGAVSLVRGKRVRVAAGGDRFQTASFPLQPRVAFERTCLQRDEKITIAEARSAAYVSRPVRGLSGLEGYGVWIYESPLHSYVWRPTVDPGWRPFMYGRWIYHAGGPYWVSADPWGWAPYHYGRWVKSRRGYWCWLPGYRFSPARVAFFLVGDCYVWAPAGYFGRPFCGHLPGCGCGGFVYGSPDCFYDPHHGPGHGRSRYEPLDDAGDVPGARAKPVAATPLSIATISKAAGRVRSGLQKASERLRDRLSGNRGSGIFFPAFDRLPAPAAKGRDVIERFQQRKPLQPRKSPGRALVEKRREERGNFQVVPVRKILADIKDRESPAVMKFKERLQEKPLNPRRPLPAESLTRRPLEKAFGKRPNDFMPTKPVPGPLAGRVFKGPLTRPRSPSLASAGPGRSASLKPGAVRRSVQKRLAGREILGRKGSLFRR